MPALVLPSSEPACEVGVGRRATLLACLLGASLVSCESSAAAPEAGAAATNANKLPTDSRLPDLLAGVTNVTRVAQLTGPGGINDTAKYEFVGADLGSMFQHDGKTWFVFGDTFGQRGPGLTGGGGDEWCSNSMAYTTDTNPADGITFDSFVIDPKTGWALEMVPGEKIVNEEMTKIPTYGFSANGAMYLAYMSVRHWGEPGQQRLTGPSAASSFITNDESDSQP